MVEANINPEEAKVADKVGPGHARSFQGQGRLVQGWAWSFQGHIRLVQGQERSVQGQARSFRSQVGAGKVVSDGCSVMVDYSLFFYS